MQIGGEERPMLVVDDKWLRSQDEQQKVNSSPESVRRLVAVTIGWLLAAAAGAVLCSAVTAMIFALYHVKTTPNLRNFYVVMGMLGFSITLLVAALIRGRVVGHGNIRVGLGNEPMRKLPVVGAMAFAVVAYAILLGLTVSSSRPDVIATLFSVHPWLTAFVVFFIMLLFGILGPLSEELFFRGWLWTGLRRHWDVLPTALLTSALWLVLHFSEGVLRPAFLLPVAIALALARHFGGSVRAPLVLHVVYNLVIYNLAMFSPLILKQA
jgi:membrane protease YdiL (CAAX protease family)